MAINLTDFDKIWASSSPLTPYSFSDANYEEGWNFVGSTPPARQMWDGYMKWSDEKQQWIVNNFLPLSGGTMTGAIVGNPLTLTADDGNDSADLVLNSSGSATWNGKEVERVASIGTNYIRYESGVQICWNSHTTKNPPEPVDFPSPFNEAPCLALVHISTVSTGGNFLKVANNTSTNFTPVMTNGSSYVATSFRYIAVGTWK